MNKKLEGKMNLVEEELKYLYAVVCYCNLVKLLYLKDIIHTQKKNLMHSITGFFFLYVNNQTTQLCQ